MYSIKGCIGHIFMKLCGIVPLRNKVVFSCFDGKTFGDNPKAIYDGLRKEDLKEVKYIWLMRDRTFKIPGAVVRKANSFKALYHLATAKIWIDNSRKREWVTKRKGQFYIQTWHAGITLKKVEGDAVDKLPRSYIRNAKHDSKMADLFLSGSGWNTKNYRDAFWYTGEVFECGMPRSDIFFQKKDNIQKEVKKYYHIGQDEKLILYVPTFRADGGVDCYRMNYQQVLEAAGCRWGGRWKMFIRLHPNIQTKKDEIQYSENVIDASGYADVNMLMIACDILVTDYSSCMFDAANLGKAVFLYTADLDDYRQDRGTYFDFEELPFPFAVEETGLVENMKKYDTDFYQRKAKCFLEKCRIFDDGNSTKKVVDRICSILEQT